MTEICRKEPPVCRKESGVTRLISSGFLFCKADDCGKKAEVFRKKRKTQSGKFNITKARRTFGEKGFLGKNGKPVFAKTPRMKKASGYRGLRRDPHGMEPSFILPATPTVARIGVRGKRV